MVAPPCNRRAMAQQHKCSLADEFTVLKDSKLMQGKTVTQTRGASLARALPRHSTPGPDGECRCNAPKEHNTPAGYPLVAPACKNKMEI